MPIYEYSCNICGQIFEKIAKSSENEKDIDCPKCGEKDVKRVMSITGMLGSSCAKPSSGGFS